MPLRTTDYAEITDQLEKIFVETSVNAIAEAVGLSKVFQVTNTELRTYEYQILHGLKGIERIAQGADLPRVNSEQGKLVALSKSSLINGENPDRITLKKLIETIKNSILHLQRLSEMTTQFA